MSWDEAKTWTSERYLAERHDQYQKWYDSKAVRMKTLYLRMRAASVVGGAMVPVLINVQGMWLPKVGGYEIDVVRVVVTLMSLIVVILVSLESVFHYREQWKNYRSTEQFLGHEKVFFLSRVGIYEKLEPPEAFCTFVQRVEEAIASENAATLNIMTTATEAAEAVTKKCQPQ